MLKLKELVIRNFMSVGNNSQSINLSKQDLVLVLGENLDLGGNDYRNGVGKCVCINTVVKLRNTVTGEISEVTVGEIYNAAMELEQQPRK